MCCFNDRLRTIFPLAVSLNRFAAPRWVFIFGIYPPCPFFVPATPDRMMCI